VPPAELARLQARFYGAVVGGADDDLADAVLGTDALPAAARVRIYAEMYLVRLLDTLAEHFAGLHEALGRPAFGRLARAYLAAYPPTSPSLRELGQHLPAFLAASGRSAEGELALLEWTRLDLFDGPDGAPLTLAALQGLAPEALAELPLTLAPTARVLRLGHDVLRGLDLEAEAVLLVYRTGVTVHTRAVTDAAEADALAAVEAGTTVGALCERLGDAAAVFALLGRWLEDEVLAG
jgi:hypothetical protein